MSTLSVHESAITLLCSCTIRKPTTSLVVVCGRWPIWRRVHGTVLGRCPCHEPVNTSDLISLIPSILNSGSPQCLRPRTAPNFVRLGFLHTDTLALLSAALHAWGRCGRVFVEYRACVGDSSPKGRFPIPLGAALGPGRPEKLGLRPERQISKCLWYRNW